MSLEARQELEQLQARAAQEEQRLDLIDQKLVPLRGMVSRAEAKLGETKRRRPWVVFVLASLLGLGLGFGLQVLATHLPPPTRDPRPPAHQPPPHSPPSPVNR